MTESRKLRVFLCHSSQDKSIVRELYRRLASEGWVDPWLDEEKLLPGQDWDMEIEKAVEASEAVIVCVSKSSVTKEGYIQRELKFVLDIALEKPEGAIFIIPLRLDDCEVPRRLRSWQYVDYFPGANQEKAFQRILDSFRVRQESSKEQKQEFLHEKKDKSDQNVSVGGGTGDDVIYPRRRLDTEKKILDQLRLIQSKKYVLINSDERRSVQNELIRTIPSWIRSTVLLLFGFLVFIVPLASLFSGVKNSAALAFIVLFLTVALSLLGTGALYRKLIDAELVKRIKLQEEKIRYMSRQGKS